MESYARIATLVSELEAGIVRFRQHDTSEGEQSFTTIVSCKWALTRLPSDIEIIGR